MKSSKGFTLIELLICIVVVSLIVAACTGTIKTTGARDNRLQTARSEVQRKLVDDPNQCFDEFKVEKARRDSYGTLYCFKDGEWHESFYIVMGE